MIDGHKYLLPARHRQPKADAIGSVEDDDTNDDDENPGSDSNDDYSWRNDHDLLNRPESSDPDLNHQDYDLDDDQEVIDIDEVDDNVHMADDTINTNQNRFDLYDDRSPSLTFVPPSRSNSPEISPTDTPDDDIDMDSNPIRNDSDLDDDLLIIFESPKQPKLEPKVEPDPEVTTANKTAMLRSIKNFIDLTGEPDTEVIDLTGTEDPVVNRNSSGIELIDLED